MSEELVHIDLLVDQAGTKTPVAGTITRLEPAVTGETFEVRIVRGDDLLLVERVASNALVLVKARLRDALCGVLDTYDPKQATITVTRDTHGLLPRVTYRCANPACGAKLFEAWAPVNGIRIVCRKCKQLGIPVRT